jgi:diguanylate cyclase (GGDEF)-like protein
MDLFARLNDARGREAGDVVLQKVGDLLRHEARGGDVLARLDGDGFAVLLPGASLTGALKFAERVRERVEDVRVPFRDDALAATLSGGAGLLSEPPESPQALVAYARERLRELKAGGRNRVGLFV